MHRCNEVIPNRNAMGYHTLLRRAFLERYAPSSFAPLSTSNRFPVILPGIHPEVIRTEHVLTS
jgi:hypothetical protein